MREIVNVLINNYFTTMRYACVRMKKYAYIFTIWIQ